MENLQLKEVDFNNTAIAFRQKSNGDLKQAYWLFKIIGNNFLTNVGPPVANFMLKIGLPIQGLIKATIFKQFCGGETIAGCEATIQQLHLGKVGTILDYSVEGEDEEEAFDFTCEEIIRTINRAKGDSRIPITVFKATGIARFGLLEKMDAEQILIAEEVDEFNRVKARCLKICQAAYDQQVPVMIDAEDSWIQNTIDDLAMEMMMKFNKERLVVYNTYQLYRHDKLAHIKASYLVAKEAGFILGVKMVRGAYMEKERERAIAMNYPSPIQPNKESTDQDYDESLAFCVENLTHIGLVCGTHNEESSRLLTALMEEKNIARENPHVYFAQLLGMSDNLSFNLSNAGYNVAKYVPYGPVKSVMPYLFRRAQENTSVAGQTSRELTLIKREKQRRGI